jgi:hypothetical protein
MYVSITIPLLPVAAKNKLLGWCESVASLGRPHLRRRGFFAILLLARGGGVRKAGVAVTRERGHGNHAVEIVHSRPSNGSP